MVRSIPMVSGWRGHALQRLAYRVAFADGGADGAETHAQTSAQCAGRSYDCFFHNSLPPYWYRFWGMFVIFNRWCNDLNSLLAVYCSAGSGGGQALPIYTMVSRLNTSACTPPEKTSKYRLRECRGCRPPDRAHRKVPPGPADRSRQRRCRRPCASACLGLVAPGKQRDADNQDDDRRHHAFCHQAQHRRRQGGQRGIEQAGRTPPPAMLPK